MVAMAVAGAPVAEESEGLGYCGAIPLVTKVGLLLLRPLVAGESIPLVLLVVSLVAGVEEAVPMVATLVGSGVHQRGLAGFGCGIPAVPVLEPVLQRKRLFPLSGSS